MLWAVQGLSEGLRGVLVLLLRLQSAAVCKKAPGLPHCTFWQRLLCTTGPKNGPLGLQTLGIDPPRTLYTVIADSALQRMCCQSTFALLLCNVLG